MVKTVAELPKKIQEAFEIGKYPTILDTEAFLLFLATSGRPGPVLVDLPCVFLPPND